MAVHVSEMRVSGPSKRWPYSHHAYLIADSDEELHQFARVLCLKRVWFQPHEVLPHYDITTTKRKMALACGANSITDREIAKRMKEARRQKK